MQAAAGTPLIHIPADGRQAPCATLVIKTGMPNPGWSSLMKIEFVASASAAEVLAVLVHEGRSFHGKGADLDTAASGALTRAMNASRFTGGSNSTLVVAAPAGAAITRVLFEPPVKRLALIARVRAPEAAASRSPPVPWRTRPS